MLLRGNFGKQIVVYFLDVVEIVLLLLDGPLLRNKAGSLMGPSCNIFRDIRLGKGN